MEVAEPVFGGSFRWERLKVSARWRRAAAGAGGSGRCPGLAFASGWVMDEERAGLGPGLPAGNRLPSARFFSAAFIINRRAQENGQGNETAL